MPTRYYLLFDDSVQWFGAICRMEGDRDTAFHDVPDAIWNCPFLFNLTAREPAFTGRPIHDKTWTGWSLSEAEYKRILRILDLRLSVEEHNKLINYP